MYDEEQASFVYFVPTGLSKFKEAFLMKVQFVDVWSLTLETFLYSQQGNDLEK